MTCIVRIPRAILFWERIACRVCIMPRDSAPPADAMVDLPAGRRGRVCMADDAGSFKIEVIGADWIGRLAGAGALDRTQTVAAQVLALLFERSSIRPRSAGER